MKYKFLTDGHMERDRLSQAVGGVLLVNAKERKPRKKYTGPNPHVEDQSHVLERAWEETTLLLTSDKGMFRHAFQYAEQYPKYKGDRCLRGIVVLPTDNAGRIAVVRRFLSGGYDIVSPRGIPTPRSFNDVIDYNLGLDLTVRNPHAIELCDCPVIR